MEFNISDEALRLLWVIVDENRPLSYNSLLMAPLKSRHKLGRKSLNEVLLEVTPLMSFSLNDP